MKIIHLALLRECSKHKDNAVNRKMEAARRLGKWGQEDTYTTMTHTPQISQKFANVPATVVTVQTTALHNSACTE